MTVNSIGFRILLIHCNDHGVNRVVFCYRKCDNVPFRGRAKHNAHQFYIVRFDTVFLLACNVFCNGFHCCSRQPATLLLRTDTDSRWKIKTGKILHKSWVKNNNKTPCNPFLTHLSKENTNIQKCDDDIKTNHQRKRYKYTSLYYLTSHKSYNTECTHWKCAWCNTQRKHWKFKHFLPFLRNW